MRQLIADNRSYISWPKAGANEQRGSHRDLTDAVCMRETHLYI